ncbi:MAG: minichromosome maintenance protein MCM [Candidatus Woesearchaeota archaeon]
MDFETTLKIFYDFFQNYPVYYSQILENLRLRKNFVVISFSDIAEFNLELSEELLENPYETIKAAQTAIREFVGQDLKRFNVRFTNLPESQKLLIKDIRSVHLNKLFYFEGIVRQKSDVRPMAESAIFECPSCGNLIKVIQVENKFKEPAVCNACGRKGRFKLVEKELIDAQGLVIEEAPESLTGGEQPKRLQVLLEDDLTSSERDKITNPGNKVKIIGVLREKPIPLKGGGISVKFDIILEANNIEPLEEVLLDVQLTEEDEEKIIRLSKDPDFMKKAIDSIAPGIYGHEEIKEAILLQFVGGVRKVREDGVITRGDIHILLVGDPGSGKSQLLKRALVVAPKARYVSGKGASGAGLTAAVVKDEFLGGWSLEAGALVLANEGVCLIDELDKMSNEDRSAMHEALEQQTITISKANIQATLRAQTTVLAAANPKLGRFNPYEPIATQIDLPPALISRFDLIFPIKDVPDPQKDKEMAEFILKLHKDKDVTKPPIDTQMLRKYLAYAKQRISPTLTEEAIMELESYYVKMRSSVSQEGEVRTIPITARQLEALIRLSEANAKIRLSPVVTREHALSAIRLLEKCLKVVGIDPSTGKLDIDVIFTGMSASKRSVILLVKELINNLSQENEKVKKELLIEKAKEKGLKDEDIEEAIEKLKRKGDIFEPIPGYYQKLE